MAVRLPSEAALEDGLFRSWWNLKRSGQVGFLLERHDPPATARILGQSLWRQFAIPNGSQDGLGTGYADILESTVYAEQDDSGRWVPTLLCRIVELKNEPLKASNIAQVLRYQSALNIALYRGLPGINRVVDAVLLGPSASRDLEIVAEALFDQMAMGTFDLDFAEGLRIADCHGGIDHGVTIDEQMDPSSAQEVASKLLSEVKNVIPIAPSSNDARVLQ